MVGEADETGGEARESSRNVEGNRDSTGDKSQPQTECEQGREVTGPFSENQ